MEKSVDHKELWDAIDELARAGIELANTRLIDTEKRMKAVWRYNDAKQAIYDLCK